MDLPSTSISDNAGDISDTVTKEKAPNWFEGIPIWAHMD